MTEISLFNGNCFTYLSTHPKNSIDALITDPPAGISFMNKKWDKPTNFIKNMTEIYKECFRVLKPGAHGLVWAIPRTSHWTATALEQAGFEIRDCISHLFGSGFPKSTNLEKHIDKQKLLCECSLHEKNKTTSDMSETIFDPQRTLGNSPQSGLHCGECGKIKREAVTGLGTALKPAVEFWWLIRKPCSESTIAKNVLKWGTGGLNIEQSRIKPSYQSPLKKNPTLNGINTPCFIENQGRFPANLILDEEAAEMLDKQSGVLKSGHLRANINTESKNAVYGKKSKANINGFESSVGYASRFFYVAKASKKDRNEGLEGMPEKKLARSCSAQAGNEHNGSGFNKIQITKNNHPTVKSTKLMEYLIRLITPPQGIVVDPFMGSGSTGVAAKRLGFSFIGIEKEKEYYDIAVMRINHG